MDTSSQQQQQGAATVADNYANPTADNQQQQEDCSILSPTLADILSDDRILRFYQCVKDIKTQGSPKQTGSMFFALCHALGDTVSFLKVPNMSKIMFRQEQQIFAVNVAGTHSSNLFSAAAADGSPQHLLQAALASVTAPHVESRPAPATTSKRKNNAENKDGTKRAKKASPRDKEYAVRRR